MSTEIIILVGLLAAAVLLAGFAIGRFTASGERDRQALQSELDRTRSELSRVQDRVDGHFSESARLFSTLAHDYHALFEHFASTARELGISERDTERMLSPELQRLTGAVASEPRAAGDDDSDTEEASTDAESHESASGAPAASDPAAATDSDTARSETPDDRREPASTGTDNGEETSQRDDDDERGETGERRESAGAGGH